MKDINFLKANNVDIEKSLELFGDIDTYNETISEFKKSIEDKITKLEKYFQEADMSNYAIYVHSLKSDCKYFGFMTLAQLAFEHEIKSKENNYDYIKENFNKLITEVNKVIKIVNEYLKVDKIKESFSTSNLVDIQNKIKQNIILVADDSEVIRKFIEKAFDKIYEITVAKNGEEAINVIKSHGKSNQIKAILLDLNMPKLDGFAVLDYMTEADLLDKMPVTIISGDSSKEVIDKAFTYNIVDMLNKPFTESKIKEVIDKTITNIKSQYQ